MALTKFDNFGSQRTELNLAAMAPRTQALGPGFRAVIWVQGCPFHCRGCLAPAWIPFVPAIKSTPEEILKKLDLKSIDGLTFSGGEPMMQAGGLAALARLAREEKELNIICFTGFRYERLLQDPPTKEVEDLLAQIDVLIDGPYIESMNDSIGLRGSSNQRIIHLSSRLVNHDLEGQKRRVDVTVADGELAFIGIPTPAIKAALDHAHWSANERKC